ncbi:hypothetical protein OPT61_g1852 [Boeremia exigua]|uniref:Uncharacterized protein n=1 Tax=Boeremia exigua TaxID=749465 RepID=A0ACC2INN6_9PLEO|nr:hypothetical protein OPT61_g1852 [Boeremia exigua]
MQLYSKVPIPAVYRAPKSSTVPRPFASLLLLAAGLSIDGIPAPRALVVSCSRHRFYTSQAERGDSSRVVSDTTDLILPTTMHLRAALPADEPSMAAICTRAFFNDDLFGRVIHPERATYPDDVQIYWHEWLRRDWSSPRSRILVAVTEDDDQEQGKIVGVAIWERQDGDLGVSEVSNAQTHSGPWPALITSQNRALDPSKKTMLEDSEVYMKHFWAGARATNWYLALCCVDPACQHRGCGRLLTRWGLERAREENIMASVIASDGSTGFYLKCGFDEVVGNACRAGGDANPMAKANVKGGDILFAWSGITNSNPVLEEIARELCSGHATSYFTNLMPTLLLMLTSPNKDSNWHCTSTLHLMCVRYFEVNMAPNALFSITGNMGAG